MMNFVYGYFAGMTIMGLWNFFQPKQRILTEEEKEKAYNFAGTIDNLIDDKFDDFGMILTPIKNFLQSLK